MICMRLVLIPKHKFIAQLLLIFSCKSFNFEIAKPPQLTIMGKHVYSHNIDLEYNSICVAPHTVFCIAEVARTYKPAGKSQEPQDPIISFNYHLNSFNTKAMEIIGNETRIPVGQESGWHYYIFKSTEKKGTYIISLIPNFKNYKEKTIQVVIS